ncbi:uncharacterized protein LOC128961589 [Oppia nitens]|uniref:uncharacterized protein LOC128961589 n=1 Tax=Oppia nitens TaxID=1686743 RepID=UPI0023DB464B|nr:uncharacterized protein LOC128961589 [Oppia nitens]
MNSINISSNWLSTKPITSSLYVRFNDNNCDEDNNEDIETLLESYDNCIQLLAKDMDECKLFIKAIDDNEDNDRLTTRISSLSMLCSAKVIEVHDNNTNEYMETIFNKFIDEFGGLKMLRCDHNFKLPQKHISLTFKNFDDLWVYGLVVNLCKVKETTTPMMTSNTCLNVVPIATMLSMFSNTIKPSNDSLNTDLISKLVKLTTNDKISDEKDVKTCSILNNDNNGQPIITPASGDNTSDKIINNQKCCLCDCHMNCLTQQNSSHLYEYIDQKFANLDKSIDNKFALLENKMLTVLQLYLNK